MHLIPWMIMILTGVLPVPDTTPVAWDIQLEDVTDSSAVVSLTAHIENGWHIYALQLDRDDGPIRTSIRFQKAEAYLLDGDVIEPPVEEKYDAQFAMQVRYHHGQATFKQVIRRDSNAAFKIIGEVEYMVCNDVTCLPPVGVPFELQVPGISH